MSNDGLSSARADDRYAELKQDIEQLRGDLATLSAHLGPIGRSTAAQSEAMSAEKAEDLKLRLKRIYENLRSEASIHHATQTLKERPLLSLLIAFGIGLILTRLIDRH